MDHCMCALFCCLNRPKVDKQSNKLHFKEIESVEFGFQSSWPKCVGAAWRAPVWCLQLRINLCKLWQYALSSTKPLFTCWERCAIISPPLHVIPRKERVIGCGYVGSVETAAHCTSGSFITSLVSLPAALLPSHQQTSLSGFFPSSFSSTSAQFPLNPCVSRLSCSPQLFGVPESWGATPHRMWQTQWMKLLFVVSDIALKLRRKMRSILIYIYEIN